MEEEKIASMGALELECKNEKGDPKACTDLGFVVLGLTKKSRFVF